MDHCEEEERLELNFDEFQLAAPFSLSSAISFLFDFLKSWNEIVGMFFVNLNPILHFQHGITSVVKCVDIKKSVCVLNGHPNEPQTKA